MVIFRLQEAYSIAVIVLKQGYRDPSSNRGRSFYLFTLSRIINSSFVRTIRYK